MKHASEASGYHHGERHAFIPCTTPTCCEKACGTLTALISPRDWSRALLSSFRPSCSREKRQITQRSPRAERLYTELRAWLCMPSKSYYLVRVYNCCTLTKRRLGSLYAHKSLAVFLPSKCHALTVLSMAKAESVFIASRTPYIKYCWGSGSIVGEFSWRTERLLLSDGATLRSGEVQILATLRLAIRP